MSSLGPGPRRNFFSCGGHSSAYIWGGQRFDSTIGKLVSVTDLNLLYNFDPTKGTWTSFHLIDQHPPGISHGACASVGESIYFYGGIDEMGKRHGLFYRLNLKTLAWHQLPHPDVITLRKNGTYCMENYGDKLLLYGAIAASVLHNDLFLFDITTGKYE